MPKNTVAKRFPANANRPQARTEQERKREFAQANRLISKECRKVGTKALKFSQSKHKITTARDYSDRLNTHIADMSALIDRMEDSIAENDGSYEYNTYLLHLIANRQKDQERLEKVQEKIDNSEKCGTKEHEELKKSKELWAVFAGGSLCTAFSVAAAVATASSGQLPCISILCGTIALTVGTVAKALIVSKEAEMLKKSIDDGDYWCNSGSQRPGAKKALQAIYGGAKQKILSCVR